MYLGQSERAVGIFELICCKIMFQNDFTQARATVSSGRYMIFFQSVPIHDPIKLT